MAPGASTPSWSCWSLVPSGWPSTSSSPGSWAARGPGPHPGVRPARPARIGAPRPGGPAASACDHVLATSGEVAARFGAAANVTVVPPAAAPPRPSRPAAEVRAAYGVGPGDHLVVAVARLHPQKDLPMLLDAVDRVRRRVDGVRLVLVGEGPDERALRARIAELGLKDVVTLAGAR